jgi:hypothetical protein
VPLAEVAELNVPQELAGVQLQVTPAFALSLLTVAVMAAVPPVGRDTGGGVLHVTVIPEVRLMVIAGLLALIAVLATEVAVITTVLEGTALGAV